ncbi:Protein of unknown function [Bacillus cereus]|nr:Protein of unknown function [Bacillus wiedmannii]SCC53506.1 Protein of unknown function [Bacillus cereus]SCN36806.1 Protein of unknown function [Bacillus wiedmannii]
MARFMYG